jgi:glycosyltransferase involved in cell wall biosynthesis
MHHYSGFILRLAAQQGVPVRIAHSHTDDRPNVAAGRWLRRRYVDLMRGWLERHATLGLGCSRNAVEALFGRSWESDGRWRVYYCGIDLDRFATSFDADALRADLKIPPGRRVIGHVGRFEPLKNHALIARTARHLVRERDDLHFLFVGDGDSRPQVEALVAELGLTDRFTFAGARGDVPRILNGVVDALMFPSEREGLPMAVVEAQTAGIPVVISDVITTEVEVLEPLVRRLSLQAPPAEWAAALRAALDRPRADRAASRRAVEASPFNIVEGVRELERMYRDGRP